MVSRVQAFETKDGQRFLTPEEAVDHELRLVIDKIVDDFFYYNMDRSAVVDALMDRRHELVAAFANRSTDLQSLIPTRITN